MALKGITANTPPEAEPHIYAEDDAAIYQSIFGKDGVFNIGQKFKATVLSNNKVRIADGVGCIGGHVARQPYGEYHDMEIANGQSGYKRNDIIVAKFITTGTGGIDTIVFQVVQGAAVQGTATDPILTQDDLYNAGKIREMPLYRVKIEGISIVKVEQMFKNVPTVPDLEKRCDELNSALLKSEQLSYSGVDAKANEPVLLKDFSIDGKWNGRTIIGVIPENIHGYSTSLYIPSVYRKYSQAFFVSDVSQMYDIIINVLYK